MSIEPAELPFRKLDADRRFDALAYCPKCRSTEVHIVNMYTALGDMFAVSEPGGFRAGLLMPGLPSTTADRRHPGRPWQCVVHFQCGNGHKFDLQFFTDNGLTWAEVTFEGHDRFPPPTSASNERPQPS